MHCSCILITTLAHRYNNTALCLCQQFL